MEERPQNGKKNNLKIESQGPVTNVVKVAGNALGNGRIASPPVNLCPSGNPAFNVVARHVLGYLAPEALEKDGAFGPRANDAHITFQHVQKLRNFIQVAAPQESANRGDVGIVRNGPVSVGIQISTHRAKFQHVELFPVQSYSLLHE